MRLIEEMKIEETWLVLHGPRAQEGQPLDHAKAHAWILAGTVAAVGEDYVKLDDVLWMEGLQPCCATPQDAARATSVEELFGYIELERTWALPGGTLLRETDISLAVPCAMSMKEAIPYVLAAHEQARTKLQALRARR